MTDSMFAAALGRVVGRPLVDAGFSQAGLVWTRHDEHSTMSFGAFIDDGAIAALVWGWNYAALGDGAPIPADVTGCARRATLDDLAPTPDLRGLRSVPVGDDPDVWFEWERRLMVAWESSISRWLGPWSRAEGYRDFVSHQGWHLAAAWISAVIGQRERADLELTRAGVLIEQDLNDGFDRHRADEDVAIAAPIAARHGLAAVLADAANDGRPDVAAAFESVAGATPRAKVTEPFVEHERFRVRRRVLAEACRRHLDRE